ncbi:helix-turn-helix domain-containing protein [Lactococcus petauri]|uniref:helix-turn-helix domain-containing protein n=1 Tax=Lactococcus petauri TaxID=1940789 RepID=UPI003D363271
MSLAYFLPSLIDSTLKYGNLSTVKVALDNFTSVASVRRKYLALNTTLHRVNLSIKNNMIRGKEEEIRWFYSEYLSSLYPSAYRENRTAPKHFHHP